MRPKCSVKGCRVKFRGEDITDDRSKADSLAKGFGLIYGFDSVCLGALVPETSL